VFSRALSFYFSRYYFFLASGFYLILIPASKQEPFLILHTIDPIQIPHACDTFAGPDWEYFLSFAEAPFLVTEKGSRYNNEKSSKAAPPIPPDILFLGISVSVLFSIVSLVRRVCVPSQFAPA
jgi:hypothetical protein